MESQELGKRVDRKDHIFLEEGRSQNATVWAPSASMAATAFLAEKDHDEQERQEESSWKSI